MLCLYYIFFFNDTATTEIYTLSLHDALPISHKPGGLSPRLNQRWQTRPFWPNLASSMHHSVRRASGCAVRAPSRAACSPPLRTPRAPPHPPSGARAAPSAGTNRGGASACPCARGGRLRPSALRPPGTVPARSRRSAPWPAPPDHRAPGGAALSAAPHPVAAGALGSVGCTGRPALRRCSAPPRHAVPACRSMPASRDAGQPRRFRSRHALERASNRLHAGRRRAVLLSSRQPPQLRRRHVVADWQALRTHRVLPSRVGRNQNHAATRRLNSQPSQPQSGLVSLPPGGGEKMSKHPIRSGDVAGLLGHLGRLRERAQARTGKIFPVIVIQEAGLDGFWVHRVLEREGIESRVVDAASVLTSRRRRRGKTDRIDGEALLRTLLAHKRGEPRVCAMVPGRRARRRRTDAGSAASARR